MAESGDNGTNLSTRARAWFDRLSRVKKVLATSAALIITVGGVASAATSVLDLGTRLGAVQSETPKVSAVKTPVQGGTRVREGVRVTEVIPDSPADHAGVEVQDVVTNINGEAIEDVDDLENTMKHTRSGETLLLSIVRDSQRESVPMKLEPIDEQNLF
jgi:S1-C subfamily serine protease